MSGVGRLRNVRLDAETTESCRSLETCGLSFRLTRQAGRLSLVEDGSAFLFVPTAVQLGPTAVDAVAALRGSHRVGIGCAPQDPGPRPELPDLGSRRRGQSQSCGSPQAQPERARSEPASVDRPEISGSWENGRVSCLNRKCLYKMGRNGAAVGDLTSMSQARCSPPKCTG